MNLEEFLSVYGYWAIFIGTFFEGETILIIGSLMAYQGYLFWPYVILAAFGGTLWGPVLFLSGMELWPEDSEQASILAEAGWKSRASTRPISELSHLLFRFFAEPSLGTPGAIVWSLLIGAAGYLFGVFLETILGDLKKFEGSSSF